jgi:hypothetical protein
MSERDDQPRARRRSRRFAPSSFVLAALLPLGGCPQSGGIDESGQPVPPSAELGYTDAVAGVFVAVADGGVMPLYTGGQGGSHIFVTIRAQGFPTDAVGNATIVVDEAVTLVDSGQVLHDFAQTVGFSRTDGAVEIQNRFVFLDALPDNLDGQRATLDFTLSSAGGEGVQANVTQTVELDLR